MSIIILICILSSGLGFKKLDAIPFPDKLTDIIPEKVKRTFQVDFTGNGVFDYLC